MRRGATFLFVLLAGWAGVPGWSGEERLARLGDRARVTATPVPLPVARLIGAVRLTSPDPAFGGFSALAVADGGLVLLSDGGNVARLTLDRAGRVRWAAFAYLPAGPGTGWEKRDRDAESLVVAGGHAWVGFEDANAIWRYDSSLSRTERAARPRAMRRWSAGGGPESLARLADGRFVAIAEQTPRGSIRAALAWPEDPTLTAPIRWRYRPPAGFDPSDACPLPDGRLLVVNRRWALGVPLRFTTALVVLDARAIRPGAVLAGHEVGRFAVGNVEGCAAARQDGRDVLWLVTDNDGSALRPTLLLKLRL